MAGRPAPSAAGRLTGCVDAAGPGRRGGRGGRGGGAGSGGLGGRAGPTVTLAHAVRLGQVVAPSEPRPRLAGDLPTSPVGGLASRRLTGFGGWAMASVCLFLVLDVVTGGPLVAGLGRRHHRRRVAGCWGLCRGFASGSLGRLVLGRVVGRCPRPGPPPDRRPGPTRPWSPAAAPA